jgi:oxygen-independent coproporphyrinogen-3 oxidase
MPTIGSLYFHIPFCTRKCPYCHFYVLPNQEALQLKFLTSLELEWNLVSPKLADCEIVSIYFGGGTPSLLKPAAIAKLIQQVRGDTRVASDCEITLEANPENITFELMQAFAAAGINRVSIGVQSLDDELLTILGREHGSHKAIRAIEDTHRAGITNITIDLMYDLPQQSLASWRRTLEQVGRLPITHLSLYNLTFEPHTLFFKKQKELMPQTPSPELSLEILQEAIASLEAMGLKRYEVSAFAKPGFESRHNTGYWTARPFWGLGPSAFSYWEGSRFSNVADLRKYAQALEEGTLPIDFREKLVYPDHLHELLAVQIRLLDGVDLTHFEAAHGQLPPSTHASLRDLEQKGWLSLTNSHIRLTPDGLLFYDSVAEALI